MVIIPGSRLLVEVDLRSGLELPGSEKAEAALQLLDPAQARLSQLQASSHTNPLPHLSDVLLINSTYYAKLFSCQHRPIVFAEPAHGCSPPGGPKDSALAGKYVVVTRGVCSVHSKAVLAEQRGAAGLVAVAADKEGLGRPVERDPSLKSSEQLAAERQCRRHSGDASDSDRERCLSQAGERTYVSIPVLSISHASVQHWRKELQLAVQGGRGLSARAAPVGMCTGAAALTARVLPEGGLAVGSAQYSIVQQPGSGSGGGRREEQRAAGGTGADLAELCALLQDAAVPARQRATARRRAEALGLLGQCMEAEL